MGKTVVLRRGLSLCLDGQPYNFLDDAPLPRHYAIKPLDFKFVQAKLHKKVGDRVRAGEPVAYDRKHPEIQFTAPVSGEIVEIVRGPKRRIEEIRILSDAETEYVEFGAADPAGLSREQIVERLLQSGLWAFLRQRPYGIIARPNHKPAAIFISGFDSAPMAPDVHFVMRHYAPADFQAGLEVLRKLTDGPIHLNVDGNKPLPPAYKEAQGVERNTFYGPHPAGNVGVQIHHLEPVIGDKKVWYIGPQDVVALGRLFKEGRVRPERIVAVAGNGATRRVYYRTLVGAAIESLVKGKVVTDRPLRYISGNVFNGVQIEPTGYLGFYHTQVTVIFEAHEPEFLGWMMPEKPRPTVWNAFCWKVLGEDCYEDYDTMMNGEERPFVYSGIYEQYLPMDIFPEVLMRAILARDFEKMEKLGIKELEEEDLSTCEFVCPSKQPLQQILHQGIEMMLKDEGLI